MSTTRPFSRLPGRLALLALGLAGCSSGPLARRGDVAAGGGGNGGASNLKTFVTVGDKPQPVVTGEPGSSVVSAEPGTDPASAPAKAAPGARISGRVYGADGRGAAGARVRLADGTTSGGRVVSAVTDRSGAFTLRGLRDGATYKVIAEWEGRDGVESGQTVARSAETDVRISLNPSDAPPARRAGGLAPRVNRISDVEAGDEPEAAPEGGSRPRPSADAYDERPRPGGGGVNEEDLPPPPGADEVEPTAAPTASRADRARPAPKLDPWRRGDRDRPTADDEGPAVAPIDPEARGTGASTDVSPPPLEDEDVNPLPPAIEPGKARDGEAESPAGPAANPFADDPPRAAPADKPRASGRRRSSSAPATTTARGEFERPDAPPGALVVVPDTYGPVVRPGREAEAASPLPPNMENPFADDPAPAPTPAPARTRPRPKADTSPGAPPSASAAPRPADAGAGARPTARGRRRPTWGEVADSAASLPPLEGPPDRTDPDARRTAADADASAGAAADPLAAVCEYDKPHRRILDFRLPGLDGKPVRFRDIDSDLVLIDFWGTWCDPCVKSIPHLVDLQARIGTKRLTVVGVACEKESPKDAARKVAATADRLKVNYPVLLSRNDGSCPLQEALQIQAYPTMILVDREGRVLWRDQGSTPATLARLDRFIASSTPKPAADAGRF